MSGAASIAIAEDSAPLNSEDRRIVDQVDQSLAGGLEVYDWWKKVDAARSYREAFELERAFNPADRATAFFDDAPLSGGKVPVMGVVQEMTFDFSRLDPKDARRQVREFVLHYMLRVTDYRRPAAFMLRDVERTTEQQAQMDGWGYSQIYYKLCDGGRIGKFPEAAQSKIADMREIGRTFDWIVFQVRLFNLAFDLSPMGDSYPHLLWPVAAFTNEYVIASKELIVNEENPEPGVLGRYGYGCATLRDNALRKGPLLWGPGRFYPGFAAFVFEVRSSGETYVIAPFAVNRPDRVVGLEPDPISSLFGFGDRLLSGLPSRFIPVKKTEFDPVLGPIAILNSATGHIFEDRFGLSKETLERFLLVQHFMSVYELLAGASATYCRVPDWGAPENELPDWVQNGFVH